MSGLEDLKNVAKEAAVQAKDFAESEAVQTAIEDAKTAGEEVVAKVKEIAESEQVQGAINTVKEKGAELVEMAEGKVEEVTGKDLNHDGVIGAPSKEAEAEADPEAEEAEEPVAGAEEAADEA